jgi:hypothetical protein
MKKIEKNEEFKVLQTINLVIIVKSLNDQAENRNANFIFFSNIF